VEGAGDLRIRIPDRKNWIAGASRHPFYWTGLGNPFGPVFTASGVTSKPANGKWPGTKLFYSDASCGGKSVFVRQLRGPHLSTWPCPPELRRMIVHSKIWRNGACSRFRVCSVQRYHWRDFRMFLTTDTFREIHEMPRHCGVCAHGILRREVLISATSGVFAHKPPIRPENAKENGADQIVVIVIVMVVVAMVVGVVSSPIWAPTSTWPWWSSSAWRSWRSWEERQQWSCGGYISDRPQSAQCAGLHLRPCEGR
jgi:hypothetical protein